MIEYSGVRVKKVPAGRDKGWRRPRTGQNGVVPAQLQEAKSRRTVP
jgi:hypothetical protein